MAPRLLVIALASALLLGACAGEDPVVPGHVAEAYEQYREAPSATTYLGFIQANRKAAMEHEFSDDERGFTHQLWSLEVQADHAARNADLRLAQSVVTTIDELFDGGVIDVFDEVVPGARERLAAARERVAGMLE